MARPAAQQPSLDAPGWTFLLLTHICMSERKAFVDTESAEWEKICMHAALSVKLHHSAGHASTHTWMLGWHAHMHVLGWLAWIAWEK